jgi:hypothetical protein
LDSLLRFDDLILTTLESGKADSSFLAKSRTPLAVCRINKDLIRGVVLAALMVEDDEHGKQIERYKLAAQFETLWGWFPSRCGEVSLYMLAISAFLR